MKYLDSGARDPSQALGHWLDEVLRDGDVAEVRWQSGFYTADGLGFLAPTLDRIRAEGGKVTALVGSNNGDTLRDNVLPLLALLGIPREGARFGVVSFAGAFYHPKTYHLTRRDGSEAAYVGSANLTSAGVGSLHVEAGLVLDTRDGDDPSVLAAVGAAVDVWFAGAGRAGLTVVDGEETVERLVAEGVLAEAPTPRAENEGGAGSGGAGPTRPRLNHLRRPPPWQAAAASVDAGTGADQEDVEEEDVSEASAEVEWETVWRSNGMSRRDLTIPVQKAPGASGKKTNATGAIGLRKGGWTGDIDHRHYFRDEVFAALTWSTNPRLPYREVATAIFEVWIDGAFVGETSLIIRHNTDTTSKTYLQDNEMTHLSWGPAKAWVARPDLLGAVMTLDRERAPNGLPKFRIRFERP